MSRSPDPESNSTSISPPTYSCVRETASPLMFVSRRKSPVSDITVKGSSSPFPSYPIVIPTVRRAPPSPDSRLSRSPVPSHVPVITTGRRGSTSVGISSSSSPRRDRSPSSPHELLKCDSPSEDIVEMHHPGLLTDAKSRRESSLTARRFCAAGDRSDVTPPAPDSRQLKFGVERILSEEISPVIRRHQHQEAMLVTPSVPCSECVSSLLRCCRLGAPGCESTSSFCTPYAPGYYTTLHTPRPVRPYMNMLPSDGVHLSTSDRGSASVGSGGSNKRKRSWSRAVFSNLQRKGLEKRFQLQKYITKPDRRQLAATLGLTDAQVKVWFQNRRMKWRHSKEAKHQQSSNSSNENRCAREEQGGPDSTQEPEIDIQTVDS
ncbi:homeobox protein ARX isoform X1 [Cryptotermes secundus]|uniref:homeobox protein ARX isoform X1 n=1 Tax=Cryptotermes secundus TaxID=105785 RepID=UPI000CD7D9C4|nr:homeobox protein ARX isoform X1 [Cryptotermes secundus]